MTTLTPGMDVSSWSPESSSPTTEKFGILSTPNEETSLLLEATSVSAVCRMTLTPIHRTGAGTARTIGCSPLKRQRNWSLSPDQSMVSRFIHCLSARWGYVLIEIVQCGAGVGTVLVILMDPMWTLFGNTCNLGRTLKRQSRSSITEICLDGRFLKERCVSVFACREKEKKSLLTKG